MKILFLLALTALQLFAQMPLTLQEAQRLAIQNNPAIASAKSSAAAARQVPLEVRSNLFPTVGGSVTAAGADSGSRLAAGGLNNPAVYSRLAAGLAVSQLVTDFGRTRTLVESAKLRADAQDQAAESTRANILIATVRAYYGVLRAQAVLTVAQQSVATRQVVAEQVAALTRNNLKSGLDLSFANVNLADAQLLLSQAQNGVKAAEADLASAIGVPPQTTFALASDPALAPLPPNSDPVIAQALQDRPELKSLRLEQTAAERVAKAEHSLIYPTVGILGNAGVVPTGEPQVASRYGAIGVNLSIPVFNGGLFRARQAEAEYKAAAAGHNVNDLANRVTRDVRVAYLNAESAYERIALTDQLLQQARLALDLAQGRYDLGLSSIVELTQAQLNLTSAQIGTASARYDYQIQRAILDYQAGALR